MNKTKVMNNYELQTKTPDNVDTSNMKAIECNHVRRSM
jgi:hypothetical protein